MPGAFMSLLGITYLNQIVDFQGITDVAEILRQLHLCIHSALKQSSSQNQDGMDISLCLIDRPRQVIEYAGAKSPLLYIQDQELNVIRGDKFSIGGHFSERSRLFTKHIIPYNAQTTFYLSSDGYRDQFGYLTDKRFMMSAFKNLLVKIHTLPMSQQYQILRDTHENWKGHFSQTDDILVMGFRI
ncbi:MAG: SpoIIE family protein phosphatase [Bacteroidia bacterium]|nr:SpoIIE family protein phosphatase [Bacteroidia bacterium]